MPAPICIMASVMMKDGMPISVTPKALTAPEREAGAERQEDRAQPGSGRLAMFT